MTADPWASQDPWASNEDTGPASPWSTEEAPTEDNKESAVPDNTNSEIVVTFKQHGGYDAPWLVVHAADAADAERQLLEIKSGNLLRAVSSVAGDFAATKGAVQPARAQAAPQQAPAQPQQAPQQQGGYQGDGRTCNHGVMTYKEGFNQAKQTGWKAYFCPTPKDTPGQCRPVFVK